MDDEEETVESLAEAMQGIFHVLEAHAGLLVHIMRTLEGLGVRFDRNHTTPDTKH
jgi:hypothetical protein